MALVVITGANRGIGLALVEEALKRGNKVVAVCRHSSSELDRTGAEVVAGVEVTDGASVAKLADRLAGRRIDVLVNNAGVLLDPRGSRFLDTQLETYRETLEANLFGPIQLAHAVVPLMKANRYGRIVNLSSGLGQLSEMGSGTPAYRISKTALNALTRILAAEFKENNILANAMCPGWTRTGMGGESAPRTPEEAAETALWLATLPDDGPTGGLFRDREAIAW
jgi:NAD(P)-dependent dehydrogenase (short-subunit alcohol dehydrogenase family)